MFLNTPTRFILTLQKRYNVTCYEVAGNTGTATVRNVTMFQTINPPLPPLGGVLKLKILFISLFLFAMYPAAVTNIVRRWRSDPAFRFFPHPEYLRFPYWTKQFIAVNVHNGETHVITCRRQYIDRPYEWNYIIYGRRSFRTIRRMR